MTSLKISIQLFNNYQFQLQMQSKNLKLLRFLTLLFLLSHLFFTVENFSQFIPRSSCDFVWSPQLTMLVLKIALKTRLHLQVHTKVEHTHTHMHTCKVTQALFCSLFTFLLSLLWSMTMPPHFKRSESCSNMQTHATHQHFHTEAALVKLLHVSSLLLSSTCVILHKSYRNVQVSSSLQNVWFMCFLGKTKVKSTSVLLFYIIHTYDNTHKQKHKQRARDTRLLQSLSELFQSAGQRALPPTERWQSVCA